MKTTSFILLGVGCLGAFGQTNSACVPDQWLSLPQAQLREVISDDEASSEAPTAQVEAPGGLSTTVAPESSNVGDGADSSFTLEQADATKREMDASLYRRLKAQGCFTPKQPEADNYFVRSVNTMFDQEEMRVGKTTVTCSLVTAIKKKNPLCLLNPVLLNISW